MGHKSCANLRPIPWHSALGCETPMSSHPSGGTREGFPEKVALEQLLGLKRKIGLVSADKRQDRPGATRLQN